MSVITYILIARFVWLIDHVAIAVHKQPVKSHQTSIQSFKNHRTIITQDKKTQLSLGNTRYSLYSSCCSTDLQGHPRPM